MSLNNWKGEILQPMVFIIQTFPMKQDLVRTSGVLVTHLDNEEFKAIHLWTDKLRIGNRLLAIEDC